jgi:hypothetical protein
VKAAKKATKTFVRRHKWLTVLILVLVAMGSFGGWLIQSQFSPLSVIYTTVKKCVLYNCNGGVCLQTCTTETVKRTISGGTTTATSLSYYVSCLNGIPGWDCKTIYYTTTVTTTSSSGSSATTVTTTSSSGSSATTITTTSSSGSSATTITTTSSSTVTSTSSSTSAPATVSIQGYLLNDPACSSCGTYLLKTLDGAWTYYVIFPSGASWPVAVSQVVTITGSLSTPSLHGSSYVGDLFASTCDGCGTLTSSSVSSTSSSSVGWTTAAQTSQVVQTSTSTSIAATSSTATVTSISLSNGVLVTVVSTSTGSWSWSVLLTVTSSSTQQPGGFDVIQAISNFLKLLTCWFLGRFTSCPLSLRP